MCVGEIHECISTVQMPIATNREQLDILIEELELKRKMIKPKHK